VLASVEVHLVALEGDVRAARLLPAFVKDTPVGGVGEYRAPPSLYVLVNDPSVKAAKATPDMKLSATNTPMNCNEKLRNEKCLIEN
jgi:hypothetical protein